MQVYLWPLAPGSQQVGDILNVQIDDALSQMFQADQHF